MPDLIARFLIEKHFSIEKNLVKPRALLPALDHGVWATSIFDVDGLSDIETWNLGEAYVAVPRGKPLYGHAELAAVAVAETGLALRSSEPPPGHGDIVGWSTDKEKRILAAQELAACARLKLKTSISQGFGTVAG